MNRLTKEQLIQEVEKRANVGGLCIPQLHLAIMQAHESNQPICRPDSKLFRRLEELERAGMLTGYHITKTIALHVEAHRMMREIFDRGVKLFNESPRIATVLDTREESVAY